MSRVRILNRRLDMENLWTPWRFHYIKTAGKSDGCVFCRILEEGEAGDLENLIVYRGEHSFAILNRFPYTSGHLMVVAYRHIASLSEAEPREIQEMALLARKFEQVLAELYHPEGFNIGFNIGRCAGAGVEGHLHLHVIPRWIGDTNFVGAAGQTRIIPELLETTYQKITCHLRNT